MAAQDEAGLAAKPGAQHAWWSVFTADRRAGILQPKVLAPFLCAGPLLLVANKGLLDTQRFEYPILVALLGQASVALYLQFKPQWGGLSPSEEPLVLGSGDGWPRYAAAGLAAGVALVAESVQTLYLPLSFAAMMQPLVLCFMVLIAACLGGSALPTGSAIAVIGVATMLTGVLLFDSTVTPFGAGLILAVKLVEAISLMCIRALLRDPRLLTCPDTNLRLAVPTTATLAGLALAFEVGPFLSEGGYRIVYDYPFGFAFAAGLAVLVASIRLQMQRYVPRPSALRSLEMGRNAATVLWGWQFYAEHIPPMQGLCYLGAMIAYAACTQDGWVGGQPQRKADVGQEERVARVVSTKPRDALCP